MAVAVNKNASPNARKLLDYLYKVAGKGLITGQHTQTKPMEEVEYIKGLTGKEPKLRGFEMLAYSPNINFEDASKECLTEVYENEGTLDTAFDWATQGHDMLNPYVWDEEKDGIVTFSFHWYSPIGGRDKAFYMEYTDFDCRQILVEGTPEREAFFADMDVIAGHLQRFADADIPVLWRPFHESDGTWFWWGAHGPAVAKELYILMYEYYTNHYHLDNLLWVWNCRTKDGYPGDEYVDVISVDIYLEKFTPTDYKDDFEKLVKETTSNKVAALAEIGYLPDVDMIAASRVPWAYYMCWSKEFCIGEQYNSEESVKRMYESEYSITK